MSLLGDQLRAVSGLSEPVHIRRYTSPVAAKLQTYGLHLHDLRSAAASFEYLTRSEDKGIQERSLSGVDEVLWCGLSITYCRCFDGKARKPFHLLPEELFGGDTDGLNCHEWLWNTRNMYHAHDLNDRRFGAVAVVLNRDADEFYFQALSAIVSDVGVSHRTVGQLITHAAQFVDREIQNIAKYVDQEISALSADERLALEELVIDVARGDATKSRPRKDGSRKSR